MRDDVTWPEVAYYEPRRSLEVSLTRFQPYSVSIAYNRLAIDLAQSRSAFIRLIWPSVVFAISMLACGR